MQILHVYKAYHPVLGGIENHVKLVAEAQAAAGHEVTVLATASSLRTEIDEIGGARVIKAGRWLEVASTPLSPMLVLRLLKEHPDITHLHFPYPPAEVGQSLVMRQRPTVLSYHSDIVRQRGLLRLYRPLMMHTLQRVGRILVSSPNYLESSEILAKVRSRCTVIPYGIDQTRFRDVPIAAVQAVRRRIGAGPIVLFVGVLRYYKGLRYLIDAMPRVPARLVIVGDGPEGQALRSQIAELGLTDKIIFAGRVADADLPAYYHAADLFCLPASERSEAFGLVQVEALSAGLPIVSTELGTGTSYVNQDDQSGLVVRPKDSKALAEALQQILGDDHLRQRLSTGALRRAEAFTAERMLREIETVYQELLAARRV